MSCGPALDYMPFPDQALGEGYCHEIIDVGLEFWASAALDFSAPLTKLA